MKKVIKILITITVLGLIGWYFYANRQTFEALKEIKPVFLLTTALLQILLLYLNGLYLKILAEPFNIELKEYFSLSIVTSFLNLITPFRGGAGLRAIYMKKMHKLNYRHFLSSLLGNYIIIFFTTSILALLIFPFIQFHIGILILFAAILAGTTILIIFPKIFNKKLGKVMEGWRLITKHPGIIPKSILLTLINLSISALSVYFVFSGLGLETNFLRPLYLSIISVLAVFINVTPGSLGVTEGLYMISSDVLEMTPSLSLLIALSLRAINMTVLLILGPIANHFLLTHKPPK